MSDEETPAQRDVREHGARSARPGYRWRLGVDGVLREVCRHCQAGRGAPHIEGFPCAEPWYPDDDRVL